MNIVYAIPEFVTEEIESGLATYYDNLSRILADRGHSISVFVTSDKEQSIDYYSGVRVIRVKDDISCVNPSIQGSYMRKRSTDMRKAIYKYCDSGHNIDLVQYANYMGYGIERINKPTVVRVSSYRPLLRNSAELNFNYRKEYRSCRVADFIEDISMLRADSVYGPSKLCAEYISGQLSIDVDVIESPFYPRYLDNKICDEKVMRIIDGKRFVLTFGSIMLLKGAMLIGDCIYDILKNNPDVHWVFAGPEHDWIDNKGDKIHPSEYITNMARETSGRVIFLGKIDKNTMYSVVRKALLCILPSRMDNLPNTCIEAMAIGKIVIGTKRASFEQLINDNDNGFLTEIDNINMLIDKVNYVLRLSEDEIVRIGNKAKESINRMHPDLIANRIIELYEKTIIDYNNGGIVHNADSLKSIVKKHNDLLDSSYGEEALCYHL